MTPAHLKNSISNFEYVLNVSDMEEIEKEKFNNLIYDTNDFITKLERHLTTK